MPHRTGIEWCDYSSNPLRAEADGVKGWSCAKVSPGCAHCYSETINGRFGTKLDYTAANVRKVRHYLDEKELRHILSFRPKPPYKNGRARPAVFPCDMTDLFGEWVEDATLDRLFAAFALRPDVDFLVLTKRPGRMREYMAAPDSARRVGLEALGECLHAAADRRHPPIGKGVFLEKEGQLAKWPPSNVWLGVSVEEQQRADERIPLLLQTPAAVRSLSVEPLLGPVDLSGWMPCYQDEAGWHFDTDNQFCHNPRIDWCIVGGESGPQARPCDLHWVRSIVRQCKAAGVAVFVKQLGSRPTTDHRTRPEGECVTVTCLKDRKGGNPDEWPEDLRVREFPQ